MNIWSSPAVLVDVADADEAAANMLEQLVAGDLYGFDRGSYAGQRQVGHQSQDPVLSGFPSLTAGQKQFAVHPGLPEYYEANPDFLKFRLEQLEESLETPQVWTRRGFRCALNSHCTKLTSSGSFLHVHPSCVSRDSLPINYRKDKDWPDLWLFPGKKYISI